MGIVCEGCRNYKDYLCAIGSPTLVRNDKTHEWECPMYNAVLLKLSSFSDGCCFKCTHYTHRHCNKHNATIQGDCEHKCDEYELSKDRWHSERIQKWEHDRGFDRPVQTTLEASQWE